MDPQGHLEKWAHPGLLALEVKRAIEGQKVILVILGQWD